MSASPVNRAMNAGEWRLLLALTLLWSGSFLFIKVAVQDMPPLTVAALRIALAAAILGVALRAAGRSVTRDRRMLGVFAVMGLLNNVLPFALISWAQTEIPSGLASILNATTPLFTVLVAHVATHDERISVAKIAGMLLGIAGVACLIGPQALQGFGAHGLAALACLAAALSYACAGVFGRRHLRGAAPMSAAAGQLTMGTLLLLPVALVVDRPWTLATPSFESIAALAALSSISTALAYVVYFRLMATAGATNLLLVTLLVPVGAIALGALVLDEQLALLDFAGMALIALGLAAIDGRLIRWLWTSPVRRVPGA